MTSQLKTVFSNPIVLPSGRQVRATLPGHVDLLGNPVLRAQLGILTGFSGGAQGYNTEGDVISQTVDGVDLRGIWDEFQRTIEIRNNQRQALINFLSYSVTEPVETIPQFGAGSDFEVATEFGVPRSVRTGASYFQMGFGFEWYDIAERYTWKFLADATAQQIEGVHQAILEADNRNVFREVMSTLFDNTNRTTDINTRSYNIYALYNADGTVPPTYKTTTFAGTHNHYVTSGAATVDGGDLDQMQTMIQEHGYLPSTGADLVLMVNKQEGDVIRNFRSTANGGATKYDFIAAQGTPSLLLPLNTVVGEAARPAPTLRGLQVIGSWGDLTIVQEDYIPAGYMVVFATGGPESLTNPIGIREHANPALRGLRLVKGRSPDYPLQDAYYQRGFGTGIRQRGSAAVMQITVSGTYTIPAAYLRT
jgi:hypothetical protein